MPEESTKEKNQAEKRNLKQRKFYGVAVRDAMNKTVIVKVELMKMHSKYKKQYKTSKKYKVHDPKNACRASQKVEFAECRPISKEKRWRVIYSDKK